MTMNEIVNKKSLHNGRNFENKKLLILKAHERQKWIKWFALFGAFLFQAIPYGVANNILGNMEPFVVDGTHLTNGSHYYGIFGGHPSIDGSEALMGNFVIFTLVFTFGALISAMMSPLLGRLFAKKINLKFLLAVGCFVCGFSFAMIGLLGIIWTPDAINVDKDFAAKAIWLYFWYGFSLVGTSLFSGLGVPFLVGAWVPGKNRGTFLGIAFAGGSAGNLIWQVAINQTLAHISVYNAFFIYGAVGVIGGVLISILLINLPKTIALNDQEKFSNNTLSKDEDIAKNGAGLKTTLRVPYFYLLCISYGIFGLGIAGAASQWPTFVHQGLYLVARQFILPGENPSMYLANVATIVGLVYGISCLIGNLTGGYLFTKLNASGAFLVGGTVRVAGSLLMLLGAFDPYLTIIGVGLSGFTCYTYTSAAGFMSTSLFGKKDASVVIGLLSIGFAIGFAISSPILSGIQTSSKISFIGDHMFAGQWVGVWIFTAVVLTIGTVCFYFTARKIEKLGYLAMAKNDYSRYGKKLARFHLVIYFKALKIWLTNNDKRITTTYLKMLKTKQENSNNVHLKTLNKKENAIYAKQVNKIINNYSKKIAKVESLINKNKSNIEGVHINSQEQLRINKKLEKINMKVNEFNNKINNAYLDLINQIKNQATIEKNVSLKNEYLDLINQLNNDQIVSENYYDFTQVDNYFVKYANFISKIQNLQNEQNIQTNPRLFKLQTKLKKLENKLQALNNNKNFSLEKAKNAHQLMMIWNANNYFILNQLIDQRVEAFKDHKQRNYQNKITAHNDEIQKLENKENYYLDKYDKIEKRWNKDDIHKDISSIWYENNKEE